MEDLASINAELADAAEELRSHWEGLQDLDRVEMIGSWVANNMPRIVGLSNRRKGAISSEESGSVEDLAQRLGWSDAEKRHAIESCNDLDTFAPECVISTHSGRELRTPAYPHPCDYLRVTQHGFELAYWSSQEWAEDPDVIGAVIGALKHAVPAPESEDLTSTFDVKRGDRERRGLL